jgi:hypothetical protein
MKLLVKASIVLGSMLAVSFSANAATRVCKKIGSRVCAYNTSTGQCEQSWNISDENGNAMRLCQRTIRTYTEGSDTNGDAVDLSGYYCRSFGSRVCAASEATGQCTQSWQRPEYADPMYSCQKFLGQTSSNAPDRSNYSCKKTPYGACAQNLSTGQCTHAWRQSDFQNPMASCRAWLNN